MKKKLLLSAICFVFIMSFNNLSLDGQVSLDLETGLVSTGYNNVRIPGDEGTLFSMKNDLVPKTEFFYRIRVNYTIKSRHTISALYAPLEIKSVGNATNDIFFAGVTFPANTDLSGSYKFNSYRLTYRYEIVLKPKFEFGLGLTAKIRDASISLSSATLKSEKTNVGFVPIINFRLLWKPYEKFGVLLEGDALAAPQGRAEDILIAATYRVSDWLGLKAGYRILEGGADNSEVYNFSLFNYASVGIFIYL
jgi:hypothetical protein